jgi:pimeloyl-ACP methyl ester carboxylesterase
LDFKDNQKDPYTQYKTVPEYIAHPTPNQKQYFDAYDKTLTHWGVPYQELYVPTSKGTAHIITSGPADGTPIVLLHGMGASSTMWYSHAKVLSKDYRLFAIDLIIEPGKSYKTADFKNIDGINGWYDEIFTALGLNSFYVMGPSRGGWLAVNLALHTKKNIKGLILLSPVQTFIWIPPSMAVLKNTLNIFYPKDERITRTFETLSNDPSKINKDYLKQYRIGRENDSLKKFIPQMKPFSHRELRSLNMPVLVLVGDNDMINNERSIKKAKKYLSNFHGGIIADSGHFLSVDQNAVVNKRIMDFLKNTEKL